LKYRPRPRRLRKQPVDKENKSKTVIARWTTLDAESVVIEAIEAIEVEEVDEAVVVTSVDEARDLRPDIEAGNDTVNPHLAAISILTSRLAITEAVDQTTPPIRAPLLAPARRPVGSAAAASADRNRRNAEIARKIGRGDEARTTVIETDPYPEVIPPAHQVPGETEADAALSPAA
jgi:hypothetical protein